MADFVLSCCSTADLSKDKFQLLNIPYVCFHYQLDGADYLDDLWSSRSPAEFYQAMLDGANTRTSQVNYTEYIQFWTPFLEAGRDILHVCLSSGISGTINSALIAMEEMRKKYPDRRIEVADSLCASSGYGLMMTELAIRRDAGASIDDLLSFLQQNRLFLHHWFFSSDLTFYIRGGRVSKTAGFIGKLLNICPLLNVDKTGSLVPREKIRTKRKVIQEIVKKMEEHADGGKDYAGRCYICHSDCLADAQAVACLIEERFPKQKGRVEIYPVGSTIGAHTGPGTVALFFWGDERTNKKEEEA